MQAIIKCNKRWAKFEETGSGLLVRVHVTYNFIYFISDVRRNLRFTGVDNPGKDTCCPLFGLSLSNKTESILHALLA